MVLLPTLILCSEVERARVLEICGQYDCFVPGFTRKLNPQVPRIQCDKGKFRVLGEEVLLNECIESADSIAEGPSCTDMLPGESCQACCRKASARCGRVSTTDAADGKTYYREG